VVRRENEALTHEAETSIQPEEWPPGGQEERSYLDGGVGLAVLLAGGSWQAPVGWAFTAVPEPEASLGDKRTEHSSAEQRQHSSCFLFSLCASVSV